MLTSSPARLQPAAWIAERSAPHDSTRQENKPAGSPSPLERHPGARSFHSLLFHRSHGSAERDRIKATLDRCKGLKVKVEQVFSLYAWTCTIYVFDLAEWEAQQERSRLEWSIVNAYSEAYHFNGHDSAGAKLAAQHKAAEIGALDLFRQMYRTA